MIINRIEFEDMRQYDPDRCNDGGCYGYTTTYLLLDNGVWRVSHATTCTEFDYCPCCGDFHSEKDCPNDNEYHTVTTEELLTVVLETVNRREHGEALDITYYYAEEV